MPELRPIEARLLRVEQQLLAIEGRTNAIDTQVDATEQAIAAMQEAAQNREKIRDLKGLYQSLNRKLNAFASVLTGAGLIWWGNSLSADAIALNDRWGEWFTIAGIACVGLGVLALYGQEQALLNWLMSLNPWRRND